MAWRDKFEQEMNRDRLSKSKEQSQKLTGSRFRLLDYQTTVFLCEAVEREEGEGWDGEGWGGEGRGGEGRGGEGRGGEGRGGEGRGGEGRGGEGRDGMGRRGVGRRGEEWEEGRGGEEGRN